MEKKTNRKLLRAYCEIIRKNEKITVSALCERAEVARATFYIYYKDIEEFNSRIMSHIIEKLLKQGEIILLCSDKDFHTKLRKENLLLDADEISLLSYLISDIKCRDFARMADEMLENVLSESFERFRLTDSIPEYKIFLNGFIPLMVFGVVSGDDSTFVSDMYNSRVYMKQLFENSEE